MASKCDIADGKGAGRGNNAFRLSLHLADDEDSKMDWPIRGQNELDPLKLQPIAMEEETLKLQPKSFKPFKSNEEYLQVNG